MTRVTRRLGCASLILSLFTLSAPVHALNTSTHRTINARAAEVSTFDTVLRQDLGLAKGALETFRGVPAVEWIGVGGVREDDTDIFNGSRFLRHFHDPLARASSPLGHPWNEAGLFAFGTRWASSIRWMQESDWSWGSARGRLALALTLPDPLERERRFAELFQNLGQVMHVTPTAPLVFPCRRSTSFWSPGCSLT